MIRNCSLVHTLRHAFSVFALVRMLSATYSCEALALLGVYGSLPQLSENARTNDDAETRAKEPSGILLRDYVIIRNMSRVSA